MRSSRLKMGPIRYSQLTDNSWPSQLTDNSWPAYSTYRNLYDDEITNKEILNYEYEFKFPIENANLLDDETYSQASQDLFVIAMTQGKSQGTWVEFGANDPVQGSNTYKLEKNLDWSGISVDIRHPLPFQQRIWAQRKNTKFLIADAVTMDLPAEQKRYDYLSVDIDDIRQLDLLEKHCANCRFSVITYETDYFRLDDTSEKQTRLSRKILTDLGYVLVVNGVTCYPCLGWTNDNRPIVFEDWWVDPTAIDKKVIEAYTWITEDSLEIKKYPTSILFKNDPHNLSGTDNDPPLSDCAEQDYKNCAGPDWPTYENYKNKNFADLSDHVINEMKSLNFWRT